MGGEGVTSKHRVPTFTDTPHSTLHTVQSTNLKLPTVTVTDLTVPTVDVSPCSVPEFTVKQNVLPTVTVTDLILPTVTSPVVDITETPTVSSPKPADLPTGGSKCAIPTDIGTSVTKPPVLSVPYAFLATDNRPYIPVKVFDTEFLELVDTGAARSYVGAVVRQLCLKNASTPLYPAVANAKVANGSTVDITEAFRIEMTFESYPTITEVLHYLPGLTAFLVIGMDILEKHPFRVDLQAKTVGLKKQKPPGLPRPDDSPVSTVDSTDPLQITASENPRLKQFLDCELSKFEKIRGVTPLIVHTIHLEQSDPIKQRYCPRNPRLQEIINTEVRHMLQEH